MELEKGDLRMMIRINYRLEYVGLSESEMEVARKAAK